MDAAPATEILLYIAYADLAEAQLLAQYFEPVHIGAILYSGERAAKETAQAIQQYHKSYRLPIVLLPGGVRAVIKRALEDSKKADLPLLLVAGPSMHEALDSLVTPGGVAVIGRVGEDVVAAPLWKPRVAEGEENE